MPTRDRHALLPLAISSLLAQDWPAGLIELVVIDDGEQPAGELIAELLDGASALRYRRIAPATIGAKRNLACELARGEAICHWDDDDWSAPERLRDQAEILQQSGKAVVGYHDLLFWDECNLSASRYEGVPNFSLAGTSLMYRYDWWRLHRFADVSIGEDTRFASEAYRAGELATRPSRQMMVARLHSRNTSSGRDWPAVELSAVPAQFLKSVFR